MSVKFLSLSIKTTLTDMYRHVGHETGEREIHSMSKQGTRYLLLNLFILCVCVCVCFVNVATEVVALLLYIMHQK